MGKEPLAHLAGTVELLRAEEVLETFLIRAGLVLTRDLRLPGGAEDEVHLLMQSMLLEHLPFVLVEPESAAGPAAIEREIEAATDRSARQDAAALRADLGLLVILDHHLQIGGFRLKLTRI